MTVFIHVMAASPKTPASFFLLLGRIGRGGGEKGGGGRGGRGRGEAERGRREGRGDVRRKGEGGRRGGRGRGVVERGKRGREEEGGRE